MLFLFPSGRFGNQIFQYSFAKSIRREKERIISSNINYFNIIEKEKYFRLLPINKLIKGQDIDLNTYIFKKVFLLLGKLRIINLITDVRKNIQGENLEGYGYQKKIGLLKKLTLIEGNFIYDGPHLNKKFIIKEKYIKKAQNFLLGLPKHKKNVFVHIRRGDYLNCYMFGKKDISLPIEYYLKYIRFFDNKYYDVNFIILSDDISWCKNNIKGDNIFYSHNDLGTDFALMSQCDGGIISASTFSWLGGFYCRNTVEIVAPMYFYGYKSSYRAPTDIKTKKFKWVSVF